MIIHSFDFTIDVATLAAVTMFILTIGGLLLLFSWLQNRGTPALALWGTGYLVLAAGVVLLVARGHVPDAISILLGNAVIALAYAIMWAGARTFEGRHVPLAGVLAGPLLWIAACQVPVFYDALPGRVVLMSLISGLYCFMGAGEIWYARDRELISRWPAMVLVLLHGSVLMSRIVLVQFVPFPLGGGQLQAPWAVAVVFEALFTTFCLAFLRVNMAKERAELQQRKAALVDPLTGVANRRAFFDRGAPMLARATTEHQGTALLLFDLDRFKQVNDTAGHQAGDQLLKTFTSVAAARTRPGDLLGRLGGEEFGCLIVNTSIAQALHAAEQVRRDFEAIGFPCPTGSATVSIGLAMATEADANLHTLFAAADGALYRAKAKGRNRVEAARAPLALVESTPDCCGATAG